MIEHRAAPIEVRAKGRRLEGHAALFGVETRVADPRRGTFREIIRAGAFAGSIRSRDILALRDHDATRVLGRTRSGTLRLAEDSTGLAFDLDLNDTTEARDTLAAVERRDAGGMSFAFDPDDELWDGDRRELRSVILYEISVISGWPAYEGTTVQARSAGPVTHVGVALARRFLDTLGG